MRIFRTFAPQSMLSRKLYSLFLVVALFAARVHGQATSGDVVGLVLDPSGAPIPGASVHAVNTATGLELSVVANTSGQYRLANLAAGTYEIQASASGFSPAVVRKVELELNSIASVNISLQIGQVASSLSVTDAAPLIDTSTAQIQHT